VKWLYAAAPKEPELDDHNVLLTRGSGRRAVDGFNGQVTAAALAQDLKNNNGRTRVFTCRTGLE